MQTAYIPVPTPSRPQPASAWSSAAVMELYDLPFMDLVYRAQQTHRAHFDPARLEREINAIPGVLENGLFIGMAHEVLVAGPGGVRRLESLTP